MVRRTTFDPLQLFQAIFFIGDNSVTKEHLFSHLSQFTDKAKSEKKHSISGATDDVLFNLKVLQLVAEDPERITLTSSLENKNINLYSGKQVYLAYIAPDKPLALQMIQTNSLFFSPEIRELASYILKKGNNAPIWEIGNRFDGKKIFGHKFNSFTITTALGQLERLKILKKDKIGSESSSEIRYSVENLPNLIFAQLLFEEYRDLRQNDNTVTYPIIREQFALKYNMSYVEFDDRFSFLRTTLIPRLIITGSYEKFSMDDAIAKELKLYE